MTALQQGKAEPQQKQHSHHKQERQRAYEHKKSKLRIQQAKRTQRTHRLAQQTTVATGKTHDRQTAGTPPEAHGQYQRQRTRKLGRTSGRGR